MSFETQIRFFSAIITLMTDIIDKPRRKQRCKPFFNLLALK